MKLTPAPCGRTGFSAVGSAAEVNYPAKIIDSMKTQQQLFACLLAGVVPIAVVVAAVGVMSSTLSDLAVRRREIAVRLIVGASVRDIFIMLSVEAAALSVLVRQLAYAWGCCVQPWWPGPPAGHCRTWRPCAACRAVLQHHLPGVFPTAGALSDAPFHGGCPARGISVAGETLAKTILPASIGAQNIDFCWVFCRDDASG